MVDSGRKDYIDLINLCLFFGTPPRHKGSITHAGTMQHSAQKMAKYGRISATILKKLQESK